MAVIRQDSHGDSLRSREGMRSDLQAKDVRANIVQRVRNVLAAAQINTVDLPLEGTGIHAIRRHRSARKIDRLSFGKGLILVRRSDDGDGGASRQGKRSRNGGSDVEPIADAQAQAALCTR